jgi:hypothetical protein
MKTQLIEIQNYFTTELSKITSLEALKELETDLLGKAGKLN